MHSRRWRLGARNILAAASVAVTATFIVPTSHAAGQDRGGDSAAVVAAVGVFHHLLEAGDTAGVMATLAPDVLIMEGGAIETRDEYRAQHLPADITAAAANPSVIGLKRVTIAGDQAWIVSTLTGHREVRGQPAETVTAELVVLQRIRSSWRIVAIHWSSRIRRNPPPAGG